MTKLQDDLQGKDLPIGTHHYRAFVGTPERYDLVSAMQFNLLTFLGLREEHFLLDIGCGSLKAGRLFIPYLLPGRYFGIEPEQWLIDEGIKNEVGADLIQIKQPSFSNNSNFNLGLFAQQFDFLVAHSVFSHASEPQIKRCLAEAKKVMNPSSIFAATFLPGDSNYTGHDWVYPDCVTYTSAHMVSLAKEHGLTGKVINWPHPSRQVWLVMTDPANAKNVLDVNDIASVSRELKACQDKLTKLENHPYVRFGLGLKRQLQKIKSR